MSQEYTHQANKKREAFGVSPVNHVGFTSNNSLNIFCEEVVRQTKNYIELLDLKSRNTIQIDFVAMVNFFVQGFH